MLSEVFYWTLNMSILGTFYGLLLYGLRLVRGFPAFAKYSLWGLVLIRLICPIGISSRYSLLSLLRNTFSGIAIKTVTVEEALPHAEKIPQLSLTNTIQAASDYGPVTYKSDVFEGFFFTVSIVWLIIAAVAISVFFLMYFMAKSELKLAVHLQDNIYEGNMVSTPTVYGIIKPKIVLPAGADQICMEQVLLHERIHIRRWDNCWRMLAILTACLHWFNPFVWLFVKSFLTDCEFACDTKAVRNMGEVERKEYARALLIYGSQNNRLYTSAFTGSRMKSRIKKVISYKKITVFSSVCFGILLLMIAYLLLTNAVT